MLDVEQDSVEPVGQQALKEAISSVPVVVAIPVTQSVVNLSDHPLSQRIEEEVAALNNWVILNRGWASVCLKYTFKHKLPIMANSETYSNAATAANAWFISEIREIRQRMPCTVDEATKCTLLWTQMLTKCKPNKGKSKTDPVYRIRGSFLKFLFQSYKACVNHRHPSRTGELKLMNDFIAKKIHQYIFGDTDKLIFTDGSQVFNTYFPKVEVIRSSIKEKQMARDSHETKAVLRKRQSIKDKMDCIYQANRDLMSVGLPPTFNSPSRLVADLVEASPPFQRPSSNARRLGQHQGESLSTYAVYENSTVWSGVTKVDKITKTTKVTLPLNNDSNFPSQQELREVEKQAKRMARRSEIATEKRQGKRGLSDDFDMPENEDGESVAKRQRVVESIYDSPAPPPRNVSFMGVDEQQDEGEYDDEEEDEGDDHHMDEGDQATLVDEEEEEEEEEGEDEYNGVL